MATILNVSVSTIRAKIRSGELQSHRIGNLLLVHESAVPVASPKMPIETAGLIAAFVERFGLSVRGFARASGLSVTTAQRLITGELLAHRLESRKLKISARLKAFLAAEFLMPDAEASSVVDSLFKDH